MNCYEKLKHELQERYNQFASTDNNIVCFFSKEQFNKVLEKTGLTEDEFVDKYCHLMSGAYVRKDKSEELDKLWKTNEQSIEDAINNDPDGKHFVKDMFSYEMSNHEYSYTRDLTDTLDALGYSADEINNNPKLQAGLQAALDEVKLYDEFEDLCNYDISSHLYDCFKKLSDSDKQEFAKDLSALLDEKISPDTEIDFYTFSESRKEILRKFIEDPKLEMIAKYDFGRQLNQDFKHLNKIINELDLKDHILNNHLKELSPDVEQIHKILSGEVVFQEKDHLLTSDLSENQGKHR